MSERAVCAYCHGVRLEGPTAWIHATRFQPGEQEGDQVRYDFCDSSCKQAWLDRAEQALEPRRASRQWMRP